MLTLQLALAGFTEYVLHLTRLNPEILYIHQVKPRCFFQGNKGWKCWEGGLVACDLISISYIRTVDWWISPTSSLILMTLLGSWRLTDQFRSGINISLLLSCPSFSLLVPSSSSFSLLVPPSPFFSLLLPPSPFFSLLPSSPCELIIN